MNEVSIQLAQYKSIRTWKPQVGDFVIQHGWFTHWFGIVSAINSGVCTIIKAGLPALLLTIDEADIIKNKIDIKTSKILNSKGGEFSVQQIISGNVVWYI